MASRRYWPATRLGRGDQRGGSSSTGLSKWRTDALSGALPSLAADDGSQPGCDAQKSSDGCATPQANAHPQRGGRLLASSEREDEGVVGEGKRLALWPGDDGHVDFCHTNK